MKLDLKDMDEVVVMETALAQLAEAVVVSKATILTLINNTGKKGFPDKSELPSLKEKLKDAERTEQVLEGLLERVDKIADKLSNDGLGDIPTPNWDNLGK